MNTETWFCVSCFKRGKIAYSNEESYQSVMDKMNQSHKEKSPFCEISAEQLETVNRSRKKRLQELWDLTKE